MAGYPASAPASSRRHVPPVSPLSAVAALLDTGACVPDPDLALSVPLSGVWVPAPGDAAPRAGWPVPLLDGPRGPPTEVIVTRQEAPRIEARRGLDCVQPVPA